MVVAKIRNNVGCAYRMASKIWENDYAAVDGDLVGLDGWFAEKCAVGWIIEWVCKQTTTFASDNETVAMAKVTYVPVQDWLNIEMTADDTITNADIGKWFNITAAQLVDASTWTLTKTSALNLKLVEVKSSTVGLFEIDNDQV